MKKKKKTDWQKHKDRQVKKEYSKKGHREIIFGDYEDTVV